MWRVSYLYPRKQDRLLLQAASALDFELYLVILQWNNLCRTASYSSRCALWPVHSHESSPPIYNHYLIKSKSICKVVHSLHTYVPSPLVYFILALQFNEPQAGRSQSGNHSGRRRVSRYIKSHKQISKHSHRTSSRTNPTYPRIAIVNRRKSGGPAGIALLAQESSNTQAHALIYPATLRLAGIMVVRRS